MSKKKNGLKVRVHVNPPKRTEEEWQALLDGLKQTNERLMHRAEEAEHGFDAQEREFWRRKAQQGVRYNRAYWNLLQVEPSEVQSAIPGLTTKQAEQALAFFKSVADEPAVRPMKDSDRKSVEEGWPSAATLDAIAAAEREGEKANGAMREDERREVAEHAER